MKNLQVLHSKKILRSGTVVGSFKIDLHTVYDTLGILHIFHFLYILYITYIYIYIFIINFLFY